MEKKNIDLLLREIQEHYGEDDDLTRRYRDYARVDADKALAQMRQRLHPQSETVPLWHHWRLAAAIALLVTAGAFVWWHQYTKVTPPTVSEEIQLAMAHSAESGRQEAQVEDLSIPTTVLVPASDLHGLARSGQSVNPAQQQKSVSARVTPMQKENAKAVQQLLAAKRITTRSDREYWLTLPDGSLVHLNYNTHVIYPEKFDGGTRDVILDGEAYFMVAKDRRHPFVVHTPQGDIKEYGTEFNVSTRGEAGTEVVLVEGSVSVTPTSGKEQIMQPGQKFSIVNSQLSIDEVDVEPYVAWNTGKFIFEECPLGKLMDVLGRWYGMKVEFRDDATRNILFTGILSRYADISASLKAIATVADVDIQTNGQQIIIHP